MTEGENKSVFSFGQNREGLPCFSRFNQHHFNCVLANGLCRDNLSHKDVILFVFLVKVSST